MATITKKARIEGGSRPTSPTTVDSEEKLLDWVMLNASSVINVTLSNA